MPKVIDTFADYFFHLEYNRRVSAWNIKTVKLALKYFAKLYGMKDTDQLNITHIHRFHQYLTERKKERKDFYGNQKFSETFIYKTMIRIKAFIKRLDESSYLRNLKPSEIPINKIPRKVPEFLTKQEIKQILTYLNDLVLKVETTKCLKIEKYAAYMWRALVRMLYTTWLRNFELRSLKVKDVDFETMSGVVLGKGKQYGTFTFNEQAREHLQSYLKKRTELQPHEKHDYLFTPSNNWTGKWLTEQNVNRTLRQIGERAGINKRLHAHLFRHTCATHLISDGASIVQVRDKLRHKNIAVTSIYTHTNPKDLSEITKGVYFNWKVYQYFNSKVYHFN